MSIGTLFPKIYQTVSLFWHLYAFYERTLLIYLTYQEEKKKCNKITQAGFRPGK